MPGAHLDMKLMQVFDDVGGVDAWLGGYWSKEEWLGHHQAGAVAPNQWWTGWHQPGEPGLEGLQQWSWPSPNWKLIGYEHWAYFKKGDKLLEALYVHPNPSTRPNVLVPVAPNGYYHIKFNPAGDTLSSEWVDGELEENHPYLKGGFTGPKGAGKGKAKGHAVPKGGHAGKGAAKGHAVPKGGRAGKGPGNAKGNSHPKGLHGTKGKGTWVPTDGQGGKGAGKGSGDMSA